MANYITKPTTPELAEFNDELVRKIADDMVNISAKVKPTDDVMIIYDAGARQLAWHITENCAKLGCRVWYKVRDMDLDAAIIANSSERNLSRYAQFLNNEIMTADAVFLIRALRDPEVMKNVPAEKMAMYNNAQKPIYMDYRVKHTNWNLIYWPTPTEAAIEGLDFEAYAELFFKGCNQPWQEIEKAQDFLIKQLDAAKQMILIADPNNPDPTKRTYLEMSLDGMSFINSTIDMNYPGSEVFSSPVRDSVNGQLYAAGKRMLGHEAKIVEDVRFKIEKGKIVEATVSKGQPDLDEFLSRDEGSKYFGEIAIGTNPGLRRTLLNPLLNEKVGGSFHITPGKAYEYKEYKGRPVNVFNGNVSTIHWDLTIMMLPAYGGGEIILDGRTIQKDGKFIDKELEVLNAGI